MAEEELGSRLLFTGTHSAHALKLLNSVHSRLSSHRPDVEVRGLFFSESLSQGPSAGGYSFPAQVVSIGETLEKEHSHLAIETYSNFLLSSSYAHLRYDGLKLLNRNDLTGTFRVLEREVYLQSSLLTLFDLLLELRPTLLVFPVSPHLFLPFVAARVADELGIEVLHFQPCPGAPVALPKLANGDLVYSGSDDESKPELPEEIKAIFSKSLERLQATEDPAYMVRQRARDKKVATLSSGAKSLLLSFFWLFSDRYENAISFSGHPRRYGMFRRAIALVLQRSLERELREKVNSLGSSSVLERYCIFAMHYEPERTSFPEGLPVRSQLDAIAMARRIVPRGLRLRVKEHYSQKSAALRGFLGRSPLAYGLISRFPETDFLGANEKLTDLIPQASCVFTLTGSIAIEAAFAGVPVAYFGSPWWDGLPGTTKIDEHSDFESITSAVAPPPEAVFQFLSFRVQHSSVPSSGGEMISEIEKRVGTLPANFLESESAALFMVIVKVLTDRESCAP